MLQHSMTGRSRFVVVLLLLLLLLLLVLVLVCGGGHAEQHARWRE